MTNKIRRAVPEHANQLTQITIAAKRHWNYPEKWMQAWLPALTISPDQIVENESWVVVVENKPVAYYSFKEDGDDLWLDNLWVSPDFMGQGIGRGLFDHALARARMRGFAYLKIEADPNAVGFYEKMGAWKVVERHSEVDGEPRLLPVMEINL